MEINYKRWKLERLILRAESRPLSEHNRRRLEWLLGWYRGMATEVA